MALMLLIDRDNQGKVNRLDFLNIPLRNNKKRQIFYYFYRNKLLFIIFIMAMQFLKFFANL